MDSLLLYSIITGVFLSLLLFAFNRGYKSANFYLAGFFLTTSSFILAQYSGLFGNSTVMAALIASSVTPFVFLIGPFAFLYFRSIFRDDARLSKTDYLHFSLFAIEFLGMIPYYTSSWSHKLDIAKILLSEQWHVTNLNLNFIFKSPINSYLRPLHLIIYLILQWRILLVHLKGKKSGSFNYQSSLINKWALTFTGVYSLFLVCFAALTYFLLVFETRSAFIEHSRPILFSASILIVVLNLLPFLFPQLLYGSPRNITPESVFKKEEILIEQPEKRAAPHQAAAAIKDEVINSLEQKLTKLMKESTPWTDPHFSMTTLSIKLGVPQHHLRYYFNQHLNISFSAYRNRLRVEHAKSLLQDLGAAQYSIEGIGTLAGFSSKSSFFSVFKEITGLTPSEYLKGII